MKNMLAGVASLGAAMLLSSAAMAEGGGVPAERSFVLSADRMFGVYGYKGTSEFSERGVKVEAEQTGTQVSLLWGAATTGDGGANPDAIPRVSADYFLSDLISLGGSLGYYSSSGDLKAKANGTSITDESLPDVSGYAIAPRVGFMFPLSDSIGFWGRAGLTYYHQTVDPDGPGESNDSIEQLNLEPMFFFGLVDHFGIVAGGVLDLGLGGTHEETNQPDVDIKWTNYGITAGLAGYL